MTWRTLEPSEKCCTNRNLWVLVLLVLSLIGLFLWRILPTADQGTVLSGNGFQISLKTRADVINRYTDPYEESKLDNGMQQGMLFPRAATSFNYSYYTGFELNNHNWSNGFIEVAKKFVFKEDRSYRIQTSLAPLTFSEEVTYNDTWDVIFYGYLKKNVTNGYLALSFNLTHDGMEDQFVFTINQKGSNFTTTDPNVHVYNFTSNYVERWAGFLISNLRGLATNINSSLETANLTLTDVRIISSDLPQYPSIYIDEFSIQKRAFSPKDGLWYESNTPKTDYQFTITYEIYIDTDILDLDTIAIRVHLLESLTGTLGSTINETADLSILFNFVWSAVSTNQYDQYASGTYYTILHPLPPNNNYFGNSVVYDFTATYTGGGDSYTGETYTDSADELVTGFTVDWKKPIDVT